VFISLPYEEDEVDEESKGFLFDAMSNQIADNKLGGFAAKRHTNLLVGFFVNFVFFVLPTQ